VFKRPLLLTVAVVLGSLALLAVVRYYQYLVTHEWTDDAFIEGHVIPISSQVAGHVLQVYVTDNQEVHQGGSLT
jgi:membrane fusion protein (multidrug efflux system)